MGTVKNMLRATICCSVALLTVTVFARAGSLHEIWEINLKGAIKEIEHSKVRQPTVFAVRFSPDGRQLAVVIEDYVRDGSEDAMTHLLVVPVERSSAPVRQFEISAGVGLIDRQSGWEHFEWTAAGDAIVVGGDLVRIADRKPCGVTLGDIDNFYAEAGRIARYLILDKGCRADAKWDFDSGWEINDLSVERSLLCVSRPVQPASRDPVAAEVARIANLHDVLVVDPIAGRVLQQWAPSIVHWGDIKFGDGGSVICDGTAAYAPGRLPVRCWAVDTGRQIAEAPTINGGAPISVAARASRAIGSDYQYIPIPFTDKFKQVMRRRVVWDFGTGKEIASWKPQLQPYDIGGKPETTKDWFQFSISPDGQYVAEGGNGLLRLYHVEP
jgi:hypothetical protein